MDKKNKNIITFQKCLHKSKVLAIIGPLKLEKYFNYKDMPAIFVDGGTKHKNPKKSNDQLRQISVGDHDSFKSDQHLDFEVSTIKNYSDLELALKIANKKNKFAFLDGFFHLKGPEKRLDHHYANLGACFRWCKNNDGYIFLNSYAQIIPAGEHDLEFFGAFSLISFEDGKIKITGKCQYQLKKMTKITSFSAKTISNAGNGKVRLKTNIPILIINYSE